MPSRCHSGLGCAAARFFRVCIIILILSDTSRLALVRRNMRRLSDRFLKLRIGGLQVMLAGDSF